MTNNVILKAALSYTPHCGILMKFHLLQRLKLFMYTIVLLLDGYEIIPVCKLSDLWEYYWCNSLYCYDTRHYNRSSFPYIVLWPFYCLVQAYALLQLLIFTEFGKLTSGNGEFLQFIAYINVFSFKVNYDEISWKEVAYVL